MKFNRSKPPAPTAARLQTELEFLGDLCRVVASSTELQPILDRIVKKTTTLFGADEGCIRLLDPERPDPLGRTQVRTAAPGITAGSWPPAVAALVTGFLTARNEPLATPDLPNDPRFPSFRSVDSRVRAVLAVPLLVENRPIGMLAVTQAKPGREWREDEIQLLSIVGSNSAGVIELARLRVEALAKAQLEQEKRAAEAELAKARDIQMGLLPPVALQLGPWQAYGRVAPAQVVGGDSFDYYLLGEERMAIAIADVCGKGIPAAILASNLQGQLRAFCNGTHPVAEAVRLVNLRMSPWIPEGKFITLFYAELDWRNRSLRYVNAGHNPPLIRRGDGTVIELEAGGFPLGIVRDTTYTEGQAGLQPGDSLLLFSDGIVDACNASDDWFGEERLRAAWLRCGNQSPCEVVGALFSVVEDYRGRQQQNDDITLVAVGPHP